MPVSLIHAQALRPLCIILALLTLMGCAARDQIAVVQPRDDAVSHKMLFATDRNVNDRMFGNERSSTISYGEVSVAVPPKHQTGVVEYPQANADPTSEFGIVSSTTTRSTDHFSAMLRTRIHSQPDDQRAAIVYVHGFNNTFAEALYLNTQLFHDYQRPEIPVLFSWPSKGENLAYLHDRDSVLASRSSLESLLDTLQNSDLDRFVLVGHSMGGQLVMEALRQRAIRNGGRQWSKLAAVALISPDIDVQVFKQQTADMGGLPQPFLVVASENDRLLALSGIISRSDGRLGSIKDASRIETSGAQVMSSSFATDMWSSNHMTAFTSPKMIAYLNGYSAATEN